MLSVEASSTVPRVRTTLRTTIDWHRGANVRLLKLTADMETWPPADTKLDAGGYQTWTLAATKSGHPRVLR